MTVFTVVPTVVTTMRPATDLRASTEAFGSGSLGSMTVSVEDFVVCVSFFGLVEREALRQLGGDHTVDERRRVRDVHGELHVELRVVGARGELGAQLVGLHVVAAAGDLTP